MFYKTYIDFIRIDNVIVIIDGVFNEKYTKNLNDHSFE